MISADRGALICDLAETYGIYDYRSLPVRTVATLSVGLREDSRIKMKLNGGRVDYDNKVLIGLVYDRLTDILAYLGAFKKNKPASIAYKLMNIEEGTAKDGIVAYSSAEAFERARKKIVEEGL